MKQFISVFMLISLFLTPFSVFAQEDTSQTEQPQLYLETNVDTKQEGNTSEGKKDGFVSEAKELFAIVGEELQIIFTFDPEKKIEKRISFAEKKFEEMKLALENGEPTEIEKIQARYSRQIEQALQIAYKHAEKQTERIERISAQYEKHRTVLEKVLEQVPEEAKPSITKVIEKIDTRYNEKLNNDQSKLGKSNNKGGNSNKQEE